MSRPCKAFALILALVITLLCLTMPMIKPASAQSHPVIIITPTPTQTPTPAPTQTATRNTELDCREISRASEGVNTRLVLAVNASYNFGEPTTIHFQNFTLNIAVERGGPPAGQPSDLYTGTAKPMETGSVTIDSNSQKTSFQLTFVFSTLQENRHGETPFTNYQLVYSGCITTALPGPTPTVSEFSAITLLPIVIALSVAILFKLTFVEKSTKL